MTLRQYAAIKLKVPDSGEPWLDEMIGKSLHNDFLCASMIVAASITNGGHLFAERTAQAAYGLADAFLHEVEP